MPSRSDLYLTSFTAVSALGRGRDAMRRALLEGRSGLVAADEEELGFRTFVGRVAGVEDAPLPAALRPFECRNNRLAAMALAEDGFAAAVAAAAGRYGAHRIATIVGTSTSGIGEAELAYRRRGASEAPLDYDYDHTHDFFSLADFTRRALGLAGPAITVSTACSSSAKVFADAAQLVATGLCDAAVVGGADSLCHMSLRGFASLELLSREPCRPNDAERCGISIGEAAGFALLERHPGPAARSVALLGYGESCDAYHMSSPHPEGKGAELAMRAALGRAGLAAADIDYVNLHGTGSDVNDRVEDLAVSRVLGTRVPCSSTKGWTGHALGAAGIIEAVISALAILDGFLPRNLNLRRRDPALVSNILEETRPARVRRVLTNSFGFGGNNCTLVLGAVD